MGRQSFYSKMVPWNIQTEKDILYRNPSVSGDRVVDNFRKEISKYYDGNICYFVSLGTGRRDKNSENVSTYPRESSADFGGHLCTFHAQVSSSDREKWAYFSTNKWNWIVWNKFSPRYEKTPIGALSVQFSVLQSGTSVWKLLKGLLRAETRVLFPSFGPESALAVGRMTLVGPYCRLLVFLRPNQVSFISAFLGLSDSVNRIGGKEGN